MKNRVSGSVEDVMTAEDIEGMVSRLREFLEPYLPLFGRVENRGHAQMYVEGRLERLERRTLEPIANEHGVHRRPLQYFVGAGLWDDEAVLAMLREQVVEQLGMVEGVLILDASGFPKCGDKSVGVQRQWCGRLGKEDNCQVGEFLAYASVKGRTLVDYRLYLPRSWADDELRRAKAHVPPEVEFQKGWQLGYEMLSKHSSVLPHRWVLGDDAYGRIVELRRWLDADGERYLLDVPSNTRVCVGRYNTTQRVDSVADGIAASDWQRVRTRDGEKGPIEVRACKMRVTTGSGDDACRETLLIVKRGSERWYYLSNARGVSVSKMAKAAACRHYVEEALGLAKGSVGMDEYEIRSWVGWHHHMTLSLLAMLFLICERNQNKKNTGAHRTSGALGYRSATRTRATRRRDLGTHRQPAHQAIATKRANAA